MGIVTLLTRMNITNIHTKNISKTSRDTARAMTETKVKKLLNILHSEIVDDMNTLVVNVKIII